MEDVATPADPPRRSRRRPRAQPAHRLLPVLSRDPAVRLGHAPRHRGVRRRVRELAGRPRPEGGPAEPARLRRELRPLRDTGQRVRLPRREPLPVVPLPVRLPRRRRDRAARATGALGRFLPAPPRTAGAPARDRARQRLRDRLAGAGVVVGRGRKRGVRLVERVLLRWGCGDRRLPRLVLHRRARTGAARSARPRRLRPRLRRAGGRIPLPADTALPDVRPGGGRAVLAAPAASRARRRHRRPRAPAAHDPLPPLPRDPALRLDRALVAGGAPHRAVRLDRRGRPRTTAARAPPLLRGVRPLRDPPLRVRLRDRTPVPGLHGPRGLVRDRRRDRPARATAPAHDLLPVLPCVPGLRRRERARRRRLRHRLPRLVVRAREGTDAGGDAQPRRDLPALLGADVRVRLFCDGALPVRGAGAAGDASPSPNRSPSSTRTRPFSETRSEERRRSSSASRRSRSARSSSTPPPSPTTSRSRTSTSTPSSAPTSSTAPSGTSASSTSTGCSRRSRSS